MKNILVKSFVGAFVVLFLGITAFAQTPKRIDFAKEGSNSLVWEERVAANSSKSFVFYAKKGQKLTLSMVDDTNQGSMDLGKFSIEPNTDPFEMEIEVTKDYTLSVTNNSNKATSFRIAISLEDKSPTKTTSGKTVDLTLPNTERVKFPAGSIEVNLEKSVMANNAKRFVFWAKAGQEINFTVTPKQKNASLNIDFDGEEVTVGELFTVIAPKTGDYMIQILNGSNTNQTFTLDLGIAAPQTNNNSSNTSTGNGNAVRVQFAKGENSAAITKEIPANGSIDFLINVKKGQELGYEVGYDFKDSDIEAFLTEPGLQDISLSSGPKERKAFMVKQSGDHRLTVVNTTGKKVTITLYVDVY